MPIAPDAPAKINLFLHVGSPRADGYHPIESLVAFADCGDELRFAPGRDSFALRVSGPFADAAGANADNLVLKAARLFREKFPSIGGGDFHLVKNLPAGAGLGGGSSDAAAALRLLAENNGIGLQDRALATAARETGADVSVCIEGKSRIISGIGDVLSETIDLHPIPAVIVWPGVAASTPAVYRAFDTGVNNSKRSTIAARDVPVERAAFVEFLSKQGNDLTAAAWSVTPEIAEAEAALRTMDHAQLVRMSGSGSAVFALHETLACAEAQAAMIREKYPRWWVTATTLR